MSKKQFTILSPTAILGYGFPESSFQRGIEARPDLIAVDAGSTDPGPYYLGSGKSFTNRSGVKRDLRFMLKSAVEQGIPVAIGTAGGSGAAPHLSWCRDIILEIAREEKLTFTLGIIPSDMEHAEVHKALDEGKISTLPHVEELGHEAIDASTHIVAQIGVEPFIDAFERGCDVVLAGRAYDPAVFAALPIAKGFDKGLAVHLGKILECAAIAASPGSGSDSVLGTLTEESFILTPLSDERIFTAESTAAHSLYEKSDPYLLPGPGGRLNLTGCSFTELEDGRVEVRGSRYEATEPYRIKLEGARIAGYRTISMAGSRDPVMIESIDQILETVRTRVEETLRQEKIEAQLFFHIYGKNGVMGPMEPETGTLSHEIGILIEVVGETAEMADTVCSITRSTLLHYGYPGRISTAGNLAFPFSPSDISMGAVYRFSLYHLLECGDPVKLFPVEVEKVEGGSSL
jgi:hypothetical protein